MNTMQTHGKHNHTGKLVPLQQLPWGGQASVPIQQKRTYPSAQQNRVVASYAPPDLSANRRRLVWMLLGLLFVLGVQGYWWITHKQTVARLDDLTMRVEHDTKDLTELRTDVSGAMKSLWGTTNELSSTVAELRSPPSRFQDANGLYAVGRFVEAEAAFSAFLKENPISRLADEALFKAGASAALSHNCSIALAHWGDLATRFPASSFNQRVADMKRVCSLPDAKSVAYR
jgi:TolA-binding protein